MKIINKTRDTVLAEEAALANTFFKRAKGLLGKKEFKKGQAIIISPCKSVHTFFMRFPIDVLFLDRYSCVLKGVPSLKPFRLTNIYFKAAFVLELPAGTISSTSTGQGDLIRLA